MKTGTGKVYLVATPIGNLSDISRRACDVLRGADFIAAEDTRVTRKLLSFLEIKKPLISYRARNSAAAGEDIIARVLSGDSCALVTDAGTPGISDPGGNLVRLCTQHDIPMEVIPGPCAAISALVISGLPAARFIFEGFLPSGRSKRISHLKTLTDEQRTMVFYEAPHRLPGTLADMRDVFGANRRVSISRELTKVYEETLRLTLGEAEAHFRQHPPRGEFTLVVEGADDASDRAADTTKLDKALRSAVLLVSAGMSARDAVDKAARETGCSSNKLYKAVIKALR